jgi:uncharacterized protein DUF2855
MNDRGAWDLIVGRDDLARAEFLEHAVPEPGPREVLLRVDRVGVTANNVTYARLGEAMRYWNFFPADNGWGRVPLWGFADVEQSNVPGIEAGTRVYGYLPTSSHLIVRPEPSDAGFRDRSDHRADLPGPYNIYATTSADPSYSVQHEDLQILYRPLFITSFMLDDFLGDSDFFGAEVALVSSASSKTAYGTAFCAQLRDRRPRLVGLTSPVNIAFTESLGCYDAVMGYDDVTSLDAGPATIYVDVSGNPELRVTIHNHFENLAHDSVVGMTHDDAQLQGRDDLPGPSPTFFFAPTQIRKRREEWGPGGIDKRYGAAWAEFAPAVENWVDVVAGRGRDDLLAAWLEVLSGRVDPRVGHVIAL